MLSLGKLIRSRDSECLIRHRQAQQRVIRRVTALRIGRESGLKGFPGGASMRSDGESSLAVSLRPSQVMAPGEDP
jgi:hypothetical protein